MPETPTATPEPKERRAPKVAALVPVQMDPQALIAKAIEAGAAIDTIERLVALAKDVRTLQAREAFFAAKTEFKRRCPPIKKTKTATISTARGSYAYKYSPLDEVTDTVDPLLSELGLSYRWQHPKAAANHVAADCVLSHILGHEEASGPVELPYADSGRMNPAQTVGSALTYAKRYSLLAILGLAPEDDDDAHGAGDTPNGRRSEPSSRPTKPIAYRRTDEENQRLAQDQAAEEERDRNTPVEDLFPTEEQDRERQALVKDATRLATKLKLTPAQRQDFMSTYCGRGSTPFNADLAAMAEMVDALRARAGEDKWRKEVEP